MHSDLDRPCTQPNVISVSFVHVLFLHCTLYCFYLHLFASDGCSHVHRHLFKQCGDAFLLLSPGAFYERAHFAQHVVRVQSGTVARP